MFARVVALATALAVSGCSFVLVRGAPPPRPRGDPPVCTDTYVVPIIDAAITTIALAGVVYFATSDNDMKEVGMLVEGGLALGFGISALTGYRRVIHCRRAKSQAGV